MVDEDVRDILKKSDGLGDVWVEACEATGLTLDRGVPVQHQRHLIASWAGVMTGVNVQTRRLQRQIVVLRERLSEKDSKISELLGKLEATKSTSYGKDLEAIALRQTNIMNTMHDVSPESKARILEEVRG